ncbi:MAG TPA: hypothetical protein VM680_18600 [Verrucomicrobiae bacterium]|nr:hypothetical protein [Verrucomicrobiae bacterium]
MNAPIFQRCIGIAILLLFVGQGSARAQGAGGRSNATTPIPVIIDTDPGCDCDDMTDMAMGLLLHEWNILEIRGFVSPLSPTADWFSAPNIERMTWAFGYPRLPIGQASNGSTPSCNNYGTFVVTNYPGFLQHATNAENALVLNRRLLSQAANKEITYFTLGPFKNLYNLWNSSADTNSALSGSELMRRKIKRIVAVAGRFGSATGYEYNFYTDVTSAQTFHSITNQIPVTFVGCDMGDTVKIGGNILKLSTERPDRESYRILVGSGGRESWGGLGLLYLAFGYAWQGTALFTNVAGYVTIDAGGTNRWVTNAAGTMEYLTKSQSDAYYTNLLDGWTMRSPLRQRAVASELRSSVWSDTFMRGGALTGEMDFYGQGTNWLKLFSDFGGGIAMRSEGSVIFVTGAMGTGAQGGIKGGTGPAGGTRSVTDFHGVNTGYHEARSLIRAPLTLAYAATVNLDLASTVADVRTVTLAGNITFTTSNRQAGRSLALRIVGDGSIRNFVWPSWKTIGAALPASLAANKTALLRLESFGTADTDIVARYEVEP